MKDVINIFSEHVNFRQIWLCGQMCDAPIVCLVFFPPTMKNGC